MKRKPLSAQDKQLLHAISRNKGYELGQHLLEHDVRGEDFDYIMQGSADVKYESRKERQHWLAQAMRRMDERLPAKRVQTIRQESACCLGGEREELARRIHDEHETVAERFAAFAQAKRIIGDTAVQVDDHTYRVCFWEQPDQNGCACLHYIDKTEPMSKSWCACCGGHIKTHFENALGVDAECTCVSSLQTSCGKLPCVFELKVLRER